MATGRISSIPRTLSELGSYLKIDGSRETKGAQVSDSTELRADRKGLRVKTQSASVFKSASARTDHRTRARIELLNGLRLSLNEAYRQEDAVLLDAAKWRAAAHLRIPDAGQAITVGHLRALTAYARQVKEVHDKYGLPLALAQNFVEYFIDAMSKPDADPTKFTSKIKDVVAEHLNANPGCSVDQAYKAVTTPARSTPAKTRAPGAPRIHAATPSTQRVSQLAATWLKSPEKRRTLLDLVNATLPRYLEDDELFERVKNAANQMQMNAQLTAKEAFARVVDAIHEAPKVRAFDAPALNPARAGTRPAATRSSA